jgi:hypothetical protein
MKARMLAIGAAAAAGFAIGAPAAASAQDVFTDIFAAIGLAPREQDPIEYRERAPLVVPPKSELRQPQPRSAERNPAWPNDPDVVARRKAAAERNMPVVGQGLAENPTMRPGELRAGPRTASNRYQGKPLGDRSDNDNNDLMLRPLREMQAIDSQRAQSLKNLTPGEEPERRSLSEPPAGYRKPTEVVRTAQEPVREKDASDTREFVREQRRN